MPMGRPKADLALDPAARMVRSRTVHHNVDCKPFMWTATADSIVAKVEGLCA
jgi:hypothetical protein